VVERYPLEVDTPPAEVEIDEALIRRLVGSQHPDLAGRVRIVASGWDNVVARLGDHLAVRMPRRAIAVDLVGNEQRWLPELRLPVPIPVPVRSGIPGEGYPWPWLIVPWLPGTPINAVPVAARTRAASDLGQAHRALHRPAPAGAPMNPVRGVALADRAQVMRERFAEPALPAAERLRELWEAALAAPVHEGPRLWVHGDPHPGNLLVDDAGHLAAILDFGDITAGDPATDLAAGWLAFDAHGRHAYRSAREPDDALWARARGWAVGMTSAFLLHSDDNPAMLAIGRHALGQLLGPD
jgi:aminoglycoside phosphotransferase (APT) family kinase protein